MQKSEAGVVTTGFAAVVVAVFVIAGAWAWSAVTTAVVLAFYWGWFVTPVLGIGVPHWPLLVGMGWLVCYLARGDDDSRQDERPVSGWKVANRMFMRPAVFVLAGWILAMIGGTA